MSKKLIGESNTFADEYLKSVIDQAQPKDKEKSKRDYRINLALTRELGEALKAEAESQGRSVNNLTENIIRQYLNNKEK